MKKNNVNVEPFEISEVQNIIMVSFPDDTTVLIKKNANIDSIFARFGSSTKKEEPRKTYCQIIGQNEIWIETKNIYQAKQLALKLTDILMLNKE